MKKKGSAPDPASEKLQAWREGIEEFNAGRFWEAHERWERGWVGLAEPERTWVQAWIQLAGVLCLLQKGREEPARALRARALSKLEQARAMREVLPRLEIEGGAEYLRDGAGSWQEAAKALKAKLLLPSGM